MWQSTIVLPSWHLEDVTHDTQDKEAATVLNAYALAHHPAVIAASGYVANWKSAPALEVPSAGQIVIIPEISRSKIDRDWFGQAEEAGGILLKATADREETLQEIFKNEKILDLLKEKFPEQGSFDLASLPLARDFQALGVVSLLTALLSQAMYHYDNISETRFEELLVEAAKEAVRGDESRTKEFFVQACEQLLESREKFYSIEAHLVDLCLLSHGMTLEDAETFLKADHTVNLLSTSETLRKALEENPDLKEPLQQAVHQGKLSIVGGEQTETPTPLLSLQNLRWQLEQGRKEYTELVEQPAAVWGRMTYGLSTQVPMMLKKFGIESAYHLVLDDGVYPDDEQSHFSWESRGGVVVKALSRIPLSVENANTVLKLPERLAEAMNHDHLACAVLARWPKIRNPWYEDILRVQAYSPILGQFIGLTEFFEETDDSGHSVGHEQRHYLTPVLEQLTGLDKPNPISRFVEFWRAQQSFSLWSIFLTTRQILAGNCEAETLVSRESELFRSAVSLDAPKLEEFTRTLRGEIQRELNGLSQTLTARHQGSGGFVFLNPLSHPRLSLIEIPLESPQSTVPVLSDAVKHLQLEDDRAFATVEIPACGFVTAPGEPAESARTTRSKVPLAGEYFLQTEHFYTQIDPETGGIQRFRVHGTTDNLLSERLVYRLDGDSGAVARQTGHWNPAFADPTYSQMVADSITTMRTGPVVGEIEVKGRLIEPSQEKELATFTKTYRAVRGARHLEVTLSIEPLRMPSTLPDRSYYALRFAWSNPGAMVRGHLQQSEYIAGERRMESTGAIEVDDGEHRITLLPHNLPFHQRTGMRMLDSLLIVHGETRRDFRYDIGVDAPHPAALSDQVNQPIEVVPIDSVEKHQSAWLYHLIAPSVHLLDARPEFQDDGPSYLFDFIESEGRHANVRFSLFRAPKVAWEIDFRGEVLSELTIEDDTIQFEAMPNDYLRIRVRF